MKTLRDKIVVITGASSGAGRAAAIEFAVKGSKLVLASRNITVLEELKLELENMGASATVVPTDVTDSKAMINLAAEASRITGTIDVWVNNAGVLAAGAFEDIPVEVHQRVIETNLLGYIYGAHAVIPYFKRQKHGVLINNISVGGFIPVPYGSGYSASKFGLKGFGEALKAELTTWPDIHVCDMFPAFLDSPGIQHAGNYTGKIIKPAPPVYDPRRLALAIVKTALKPQPSVPVGSVSTLLRLSHAILPAFTRNMTAFVIRNYLKQADTISLSSGNLFNTVDYGTSIYGGWGIPGKPGAHRKYIAAGLLLAGAVGMLKLLGKKK